MSNYDGFWSYVHDDDNAENGRITELAADIKKEYELVTGEKINLFVDRASLKLGQNWSDVIGDSLANVGFFIPVLTPGYFNSTFCRHELETFVHDAVDLGVQDLIIPIVYVNVPGFFDQTSTDNLILLTSKFQGVDWTDLRFYERKSESYRRAIAAIVGRIADAIKKAESPAPVGSVLVVDSVDESADEEPGLLDSLALHEEKMQEAPKTLDLITEQQKIITQIAEETTAEVMVINNQPRSSSAKLLSARRLAGRLAEPAENIWQLANKLSQQLHDADSGYRILLTRLPEEVTKNPESKESFCKFAQSLRAMVSSANESTQKAQVLINVWSGMLKVSRDLRPPIRRIQQGLTIMVELDSLFNDWLALLDASGIDCEIASE